MKKITLLFLLGTSLATQAQVTKIKEINPTGNSTPTAFAEFANKLYFVADDGVHGRELWVSDGTDPGTKMLKDIYPNGSAFPTTNQVYLMPSTNVMYFVAWNGNGLALHVTDGTIVQPIKPSINVNTPRFINGKIYFAGTNNKPWVSNGTDAGTVALSISQSGTASNFIGMGNKVYFSYFSGQAGIAGLYSTDGSSCTQVKPLMDIRGERYDSMHNVVVYNNKLFFTGTTDQIYFVPYVSDGTTAGTQPLIPNSTIKDATFYTVVKDKLFFVAKDKNGLQLYMSDGVAGGTGTTIIKDLGKGVYRKMFAHNDKLYFSFQTIPTPHAFEFWCYDPASKEMTLVMKDLHLDGVYAHAPGNSTLYVLASQQVPGKADVFGINGTSALQLTNHAGVDAFKNTPDMRVYGGNVYFSANVDGLGDQLYRLEPPKAGINGITGMPIQLQLYPNPANDVLTVELPIATTGIIRIASLTGQVLHAQPINGLRNAVNINSLPAGNYMIQVLGTELHTAQQFIKQ